MDRFSKASMFGCLACIASHAGLLASTPAHDPMAVSVEELPKIATAAALGDSDASLRLWDHFTHVAPQKQDAEFWLRLAAEQGNCRGQIEFAKYLFYVKSDRRYVVWLRTSDRNADCARWAPYRQQKSDLEAAAADSD